MWYENFQINDLKNFIWIQYPCSASVLYEFTAVEEINLIELSFDYMLKTKFNSMELNEFYASVKDEYPFLSDKLREFLFHL